MQNLIGFYGMVKNGKFRCYANDKNVGWIALEDVAEATAKILTEGPAKHQGQGLLVFNRFFKYPRSCQMY